MPVIVCLSVCMDDDGGDDADADDDDGGRVYKIKHIHPCFWKMKMNGFLFV